MRTWTSFWYGAVVRSRAAPWVLVARRPRVDQFLDPGHIHHCCAFGDEADGHAGDGGKGGVHMSTAPHTIPHRSESDGQDVCPLRSVVD